MGGDGVVCDPGPCPRHEHHWERNQADQAQTTLSAKIDDYAAKHGNEDALQRVIAAASDLAGKIARTDAEDVVGEQARRLKEQRALRTEQIQASRQLFIPVLADWEPAARFIVQTFDAQLDQWRAKGQEIKEGPRYELGALLGFESRLQQANPLREATLEDGTSIRLYASPGYVDEGKLVAAADVRVQYESKSTILSGNVEFYFNTPGESRVWRVRQGRSDEVWSGSPSLKEEAFTKAVKDEVAAVIFDALTRVTPKPQQ